MTFANDSVEFPVSETRALRDNLWSGIDTYSRRKLTAPLFGTVSFLALFLAAQVLVQVASRFLVRQNVLIYPFMTDGGSTSSSQPVGDRLGTPVDSDLSFDMKPSLRLDQRSWFLSIPLPDQQVSLPGTITTLTTVASQLAADSRFMYSEQVSNPGL